MATGNHFWLDAAAGIVVVAMGLVISAYVVRGGRIWGSPDPVTPSPARPAMGLTRARS